MGFDRIRFFDGKNAESTLISADKMSAEIVYGKDFLNFLNAIGFIARHAVDDTKPSKDNQQHIQRGAVAVEFPPDEKIHDTFGRKIGDWLIEVKPPIKPEQMRHVIRWLDIYCDPSDAGPLYLDNRGIHNDCQISPETGRTVCPPKVRKRQDANQIPQRLQYPSK